MEFTKEQSIEQVRKMKFTEEQMNIIVQHLDDVTIKQVTKKLGSATPTEYVQTFIEVDPSLVSVIQEFR